MDKLRTYADRWDDWSMRGQTVGHSPSTGRPYRTDLPADYYALEKNVAESLRKAVDGPVEQRRTWLEDVRDRIHEYSLELNAKMRKVYSPHWRKGAPGTKEWVAKWQTRIDEARSSFNDALSSLSEDDPSKLGPAITKAKNLANKLLEETGKGELFPIFLDYVP